MRQRSNGIALLAVVALFAGAARAAGPPSAPVKKCPPDSVVSGPGCMDKYEATVWRVPHATTTNRALVSRIQQGAATVALLMSGGATPLGTNRDDYAPCAHSGQGCTDIYAVSLPSVSPSAFITWFQAQQACTNAGKRLPSNAEWQAAAAGAPDAGPDDETTDCNTRTLGAAVFTGTRSGCVSSCGALDMVGNMNEWVADWQPRATICGKWDATVSPAADPHEIGDLQCLAGANTTGEPAALLRGGHFGSKTEAGPFAIDAVHGPSESSDRIGFRCTR